MIRTAMRPLLGPLLMTAGMACAPAAAQAASPASVLLSANPAPLGQIVELRINVAVPAGSAVYFPETLPATEVVESHGAVSWKAEPAPGGATLKLTYPIITFGTGRIPIPGLDVLVAPASRAEGGAPLPGGSVIGAWADAPARDQPSSLLAHISAQEMRVASLFELEGVLAGVGPMPASDVVGSSWSAAAIALGLASATLLVGASANALMQRRRPPPANGASTKGLSPLEAGRLAALSELDDLLALGLHAEGRAREFYTRTSEIARRYIEQFDPRWGPSLTSTELMRGLEARGPRQPLTDLSVEMSGAEVVKFGPPRSAAGAAEAHWRVVRHWIATSGERTS